MKTPVKSWCGVLCGRWLGVLVMCGWLGAAAAQGDEQAPTVISSMAELQDYAERSGNRVKMQPGVYQLAELLTAEHLDVLRKRFAADAERRGTKKREAHLFGFSGNNNHFDLTGVTIEVDTKFLTAFKGARISEFLISGNRVTLEGLTVKDIGDHPTVRGGTTMTVHGDVVTLKEVVLHVRGSSPYGYGDLMGKGDKAVLKGRKHSGLLVCGRKTKVLGCKVFTRAFGHAFFVQGGTDILFKDCYAEGELRPTDDMLAETSGPVFDAGFKTIYKPNVIQRGYMKSLNECGFRSYGKGGPTGRVTGKVTVENCVAKGMRVGFAFSLVKGAPALIQNCEAIECERGYYLRGAVVENSRGDAKYGPLMYLVGDASERCVVDLTLTPAVSDKKVHALATICGEGHQVRIKRGDKRRSKPLPIMIGFRPPPAGEISAPIGEAEAKKIRLENTTGMPILFGPKSRESRVSTNGAVTKDKGKNNKVSKRS